MHTAHSGTGAGGARGTAGADGMTPGTGASASAGIHGTVHGADGMQDGTALDGGDPDTGVGMIPGTGDIPPHPSSRHIMEREIPEYARKAAPEEGTSPQQQAPQCGQVAEDMQLQHRPCRR